MPLRDIFSILVGDTEEYWTSGEIPREHSLRLCDNREMILDALFSHGPDFINLLISGEEILQFDSEPNVGKDNLKLLTQKVDQQDIYGSEIRQSSGLYQVGRSPGMRKQIAPKILPPG